MEQKQIDIFNLYEDLRKYIGNDELDDLFYDASEWEVQLDIIKDMLKKLIGII